eukprot:675631-Amphidinium_carterae.1
MDEAEYSQLWLVQFLVVAPNTDSCWQVRRPLKGKLLSDLEPHKRRHISDELLTSSGSCSLSSGALLSMSHINKIWQATGGDA